MPAEVTHRERRRRAQARTLIATGEPVEIGAIEKMSKSKKNTVDPDDIIGSYGADTARWFMLSDSPPERDVIWTEEGVQGAWRFVQRVWRLVGEIAERRAPAPTPRPAQFGEAALALRKAAHTRARRASTDDIEQLHFNRCVAHLYELANALQRRSASRPRPAPTPDLALRRCARPAEILVQLIAPDDAASRRGMLGGARPRAASSPTRPGRSVEPALLVEDTITLPVQVNGKKRADVTVAARRGQADDRGGRAGARRRAARAGRASRPEGHRRAAEDRECRRLKHMLAAALSASPRVACAGGRSRPAASSRSTASAPVSGGAGRRPRRWPRSTSRRSRRRQRHAAGADRGRSPQRADFRPAPAARRRAADPPPEDPAVVDQHVGHRRCRHQPRRTSSNYGINATYTLIELASGKRVLTATTVARVSYDIPGQQQRFARARGLRDAESRAAKVIAEQIKAGSPPISSPGRDRNFPLPCTSPRSYSECHRPA